MTISTILGSRTSLYFAGILLLGAIWTLLSLFYPPVILPSPWETGLALLQLISDGTLWRETGITLLRILVAFAVSSIAGGGLGILAGLRPRAYPLLKPAVDLAMSAPPITWLVLALIWFGTGSMTPIITVVIVATPVVFSNVFAGFCSQDRELIAMAQVYGAKGRTMFWDVYLPGLAPHLFAGLQVAGSLAVRVGVMGELLGSDSGVGNALALARIFLDTPQVFAWVAVTVMLLLILEGFVLRPLQRRAESWRRRV